MAAKSLLDVKHKRLKAKKDAKKASLPPPPVAKEHLHQVRNPTGKNNHVGRRPKTTGIAWGPIEDRYVKGYLKPSEQTGEMVQYWPSAMELAQEVGLVYATVNNRCSVDGWVKKREEWQARLKKAKDDADLEALRESELRIRRKALKGAEMIIDRVAGLPEKLSMVDSADPGDLAQLAGALRRSQEVANVAIGIPKDGVKPPSTDDPGDLDGAPVSAWARMRASRQEILVGVRISTN